MAASWSAGAIVHPRSTFAFVVDERSGEVIAQCMASRGTEPAKAIATAIVRARSQRPDPTASIAIADRGIAAAIRESHPDAAIVEHGSLPLARVLRDTRARLDLPAGLGASLDAAVTRFRDTSAAFVLPFPAWLTVRAPELGLDGALACTTDHPEPGWALFPTREDVDIVVAAGGDPQNARADTLWIELITDPDSSTPLGSVWRSTRADGLVTPGQADFELATAISLVISEIAVHYVRKRARLQWSLPTASGPVVEMSGPIDVATALPAPPQAAPYPVEEPAKRPPIRELIDRPTLTRYLRTIWATPRQRELARALYRRQIDCGRADPRKWREAHLLEFLEHVARDVPLRGHELHWLVMKLGWVYQRITGRRVHASQRSQVAILADRKRWSPAKRRALGERERRKKRTPKRR